MAMSKFRLFLVVVGLSTSLFVTPAVSILAAATVPACSPSQLKVTSRPWIPEYSVAGTTEEWLPVRITNAGATCTIGGLPKIVPTGVRLKSSSSAAVVVESAIISTTKYKMLTLVHGKAAFTYLKLEFRSGPSSAAKKWIASCRPSVATGFTISIVPTKYILNRHVTVTIPDVCTTGRANDLSVVPLAAAPPH
jgi:hypothetical protein